GAYVSAGSFGKYLKSTFIPSVNSLAGTYTQVDYKAADGSIEATYTDKIIIAPVAGELSQFTITNFWDGGGEVITASIDFNTGILKILPQVIYIDTDYGNCKLFPYNVSANTVDKSVIPVTGTLGTDGVITIDSWAAIVDAGSFGKYLKSTLTKSAASAVSGRKGRMSILDDKNSTPLKVKTDFTLFFKE
ncbi:MAG: hypothetical protein WC542_15515, partial [Paludibacter sp.]